MSDTEKPSESKPGSILLTILTLIIGVGIYFSAEGNRTSFKAYFGLSTPLDKALSVGVSTRADTQEYQHEGGLTYSDLWRTFSVAEYEARYDTNNVLGMVVLKLNKIAIYGTDASLANVRRRLKNECGTEWQTNEAGNGIYASRADGMQCTALDQGPLYVVVSVGKVPQEQPAPVSQAPAQPQTAAPSVEQPLVIVQPIKVTDVLPYEDVYQPFLMTGTIAKTDDPLTALFKLAKPVTIRQKVDIGNGELMSDFQDGRVFTEFEILVRENLGGIPDYDVLGEYEVTVACPRAGCWIESIKLP